MQKLKKKLQGVSSKPAFLQIIEDRLPDTSLLYSFVINIINANATVTSKKNGSSGGVYHSFSERNMDSGFGIRDSSFQNGGWNVDKKRKNPICHFRLEGKVNKKLNSAIARSGYRSKSDFISALVLAAVSGPDAAEKETGITIPENAKDWISQNTPALPEEEIRKRLLGMIDTMLMPVVALRGAAIAAESGWKELRLEFHEQNGIWLTESEIRDTIEQYELLSKAKLEEHRNRTLEGE